MSSSSTPETPPSATSSPETEIKILSQAEIDQVAASGLVDANNRFGWQLFHQIYQDSPGKNHFISPISATLALQMALQGAKDETLTQMKQALGLTQIDDSTLLATVPLLIRKLQRPADDITLELANSLWANQAFEFLPGFTDTVTHAYRARSEVVDFLNPDTFSRINAWVNEATHGKISQVVSEPQTPAELQGFRDTVAYLINAIYFNAKWTIPFDKHETVERPFYLEDGTQKQVQMMRLFAELPYLSPSDAFPYQGIALPYGQRGRLRMYIFLPTTGKTLADLQQDLRTQDFESIRSRFYYEGGSLQLPRFKLKWQRQLNQDLIALGMPLAFDTGRANFLNMARPRTPDETIYLSEVAQYSFVDVHEEGTEAAAVTVVAASAQASSEPQRTHSMVVDHPFVFLIRDEDTGQILFMGSITDPSTLSN